MSNEINPIKPKPVQPVESPPTSTDNKYMETTQHSTIKMQPPVDSSKTTSKVSTAGNISYAGKDSIAEGSHASTQALPSGNFPKVNVHADKPVLPQPLTDNQIPLTPSYDNVQKKMVQNFYQQQVGVQVANHPSLSKDDAGTLYVSITQNTPLPQNKMDLAPLAQTIKISAEGVTRKQADLPKNWTASSTSANDWTPIPKQPYTDSKKREINTQYDTTLLTVLEQHITSRASSETPLNDKQIGLLHQAVSTGKVDSSIADDFVIITAQATTETQKANGLPSSWFKDTPKVEDWKPVNLGIINPIAVGQAQSLELMKNVEVLVKNYGDAGVKVRQEFPNLKDSGDTEGTNQTGTVAEYMNAITNALVEVQKQIERLQAMTGNQAEDLSKLKTENIEQQQIVSNNTVQENLKAADVHGIMKWVGVAMKIIGPVLAVVAIAGAALTGGALAALAVAAVALVVAVYTVADSQFGITDKIVSGVDTVISKIAPNSKVAQSIIKVMVVVVIVATVIALCFTGAGEESASVAAKFIAAMAKPLAMQVIVMVVISSDALPELVSNIALALGCDDKTSKIMKAVTVVVELVTMVAVMIVAGKASAPKGAAVEATAETAEEASRTMRETFDAMLQEIQQAPAKVQQKFVEIKEAFGDLIESLKTDPRELKNFISDFKDMDVIQKVGFMAQQSPMVGHVVSGSVNAILYGYAADIAAETGKLKAESQYLTQMLKALSELMDNLLQSMSDLGQDTGRVGNDLTNFFESLGSTVDQFSKPVRG